MEVSGVDFSNESRNLQIANYLQTLRLEQDLSLEQLSHLSQVPIVHLVTIEEGQFLRFDDFYLRMYLKRYTQSLEVDLEQLYVYASQNPLQEVETQAKEKQANERQMTQTQADISAVPKSSETPKLKRKKTTIKAANIARLEAKQRVRKFVVGLFLFILLIVIVIFVVELIRSLPEREPEYEEVIPPIESPNLTLEPESEEDIDDDEDDTEEDVEEEPEPTPEDLTTIAFESHVGETQNFTVTTALDEIVIRIEITGQNWIETTGNTYSAGDVFEYTFDPDDSPIRVRLGALHNTGAIYVNDVSFDFVYEGINGAQNFDFHIETE